MTEKENREFEEKIAEKIAEHRRQVEEKGYAERGDERFYEIETLYGKVWYITVLARQERIFRNVTILHTMLSSGVEIDPARLDDLAVHPSYAEKLDEWVEKNGTPEDIEYIDRMTARAIKYYGDNLREMFAVNMQNYADEAFFYALVKTVGEVNPTPPATEYSTFDVFARFAESRLKSRLNLRKASGKKPKRTGEELQEMLSLYDSLLPLIRAAKKDYTPMKGKHGWVKAIKDLHPHLPASIIERFDERGVTPGELALAMVAEKFNAEPTEALRKKIMETRKVNKKR